MARSLTPTWPKLRTSIRPASRTSLHTFWPKFLPVAASSQVTPVRHRVGQNSVHHSVQAAVLHSARLGQNLTHRAALRIVQTPQRPYITANNPYINPPWPYIIPSNTVYHSVQERTSGTKTPPKPFQTLRNLKLKPFFLKPFFLKTPKTLKTPSLVFL
jgi:hypothetical protein